jgi:hypothetical protein
MPYNLNDEEIPQSKRDWLYQKLMSGASRENTDAADLAAVQNQAAQQAAGLGVIEAGATIGKALAGGGPQGPATTQAQAANRQGLEDYLKRKQLERNAEYDKLQYVKELADLETAENRANLEVQKTGLPKLVENWIGEKGEPLYTIPSKPGFITSDGLPYTGKPKSFKQEGVNIQLGNLDVKKDSLEIQKDRLAESMRRNGWSEGQATDKRAFVIGKELNEEGASMFNSVAPGIEAVLNKKGEIPGYGKVEGAFNQWFLSDKANAFRSQVQQLLAPIRKGLFGATLTGNELEAFQQFSSTGKGYSEADLRSGLTRIINAQRQKFRDIEAMDPQGAALYKQNQRLYSGNEPTTDAPVGVAAPKLGKTKYKMVNGKLTPSN